jgi:RNA polymerase sigma-70 factor (ECF subfamily)
MFEQQDLINEMGKLRKFAQRLTKNAHNAEDLLQSTMLRALEKKESFQNETNLFSWTSKIMFNLFASGHRQKRKFETQYDPQHYIDQVSVSSTQEAAVDLITVNESMKQLSTEHREILLMISAKGMSYEEVSTALKIPAGTVRSRMNRARNHLQAILNPPVAAPYQIPAYMHAAIAHARIAA